MATPVKPSTWLARKELIERERSPANDVRFRCKMLGSRLALPTSQKLRANSAKTSFHVNSQFFLSLRFRFETSLEDPIGQDLNQIDIWRFFIISILTFLVI